MQWPRKCISKSVIDAMSHWVFVRKNELKRSFASYERSIRIKSKSGGFEKHREGWRWVYKKVTNEAGYREATDLNILRN